MDFSRGENIRCTFLAWGDPSKNGWQGAFPAVASVNGPWRKNNTEPAPNNSQEACFSLWLNQPLRFSQDEWNTGPPLSGSYNAAWANSEDKASAVLHRVTLGDEIGAKAEWSIDGGATWVEEVNSVGNSGGSQLDNLFLGFATSGAAVFIDRDRRGDRRPDRDARTDPHAVPGARPAVRGGF